MKVCLAAVFAIGLVACSSSDQAAPAPTAPPPPPQAEQDLEEFRNQILAPCGQLGSDDTADIGNTVAELQVTRKERQDAAAAMVMEANVKAAEALFAGFGGSTGFFIPLDQITVADEDGGGGMASFTLVDAATPPLSPGVGGNDVMTSAKPMLGM